MPKPYYGKEGLTIASICGIRFGYIRFGYGGLAVKDYDALFKDAPYSTILHFTPLLDCLII
jgi:hypothetical protein